MASNSRHEETVPIASLKAPERNVRLHPDAQIAELARAVEMFGQTRRVVIDEDSTVLAGNGLVAALKKLGREDALVLRITGLTPSDKSKLMLSDNKIYSLGHDDFDNIMGLIRGLDDFNIPGFDADLLSGILANQDVVDATLKGFGAMSDADRANRLRTAETQTGARSIVCPHCGKEFLVQ